MAGETTRQAAARRAYWRIEESFIAWAAERDDVRAAVVVGSRARQDHAADEWGDLDIIVYCADPEKYLSDAGWLGEVGQVILNVVSRTPGGEAEQLVIFEGGLCVDFVPVDAGQLERVAQAGRLPENFNRGFRVLVDKDGTAAALGSHVSRPPPFRQPSEAALLPSVSAFWHGAYFAARQLRRGDLWRATTMLAEIPQRMLPLLELHARATRGWEHDTWHNGRYIDEWLDAAIRAELPDVFPGYSQTDCWRSLLAVIRLFDRLSRESFEILGYDYPREVVDKVRPLIEELHSEAS